MFQTASLNIRCPSLRLTLHVCITFLQEAEAGSFVMEICIETRKGVPNLLSASIIAEDNLGIQRKRTPIKAKLGGVYDESAFHMGVVRKGTTSQHRRSQALSLSS